jgi:membrane protein
VLTVASPDGLLALARWPVLLGLLVVGIGVLYRVVPIKKPAPRLLTPGSLTAAALAVLTSLLFSIWAGTFGSYNETYGSLAAVVILLLWFQLTAMSVLVGAEVNQVVRDRAR